MDGKLLIAKSLLLAGSVLVAFPAAAVSYHSVWGVTQIGDGTKFIVLPNKATHFCYLNKVASRDLSNANKVTWCRVYPSNQAWVLRASVEGAVPTTASCEAICYNN